MPQFGHQGGFDTVAYITGPSHVFLGVRFSEEPSGSIELLKYPPVGAHDRGQLDERKIAESIQAGVAAANTETGAKLAVAQAFYVEDDSPRYDLFERCAYLLASRRSRPSDE
jgi:hypothetical protein